MFLFVLFCRKANSFRVLWHLPFFLSCIFLIWFNTSVFLLLIQQRNTNEYKGHWNRNIQNGSSWRLDFSPFSVYSSYQFSASRTIFPLNPHPLTFQLLLFSSLSPPYSCFSFHLLICFPILSSLFHSLSISIFTILVCHNPSPFSSLAPSRSSSTLPLTLADFLPSYCIYSYPPHHRFFLSH